MNSFALYLMFCVGLPAGMVFVVERTPKWARFAAVAWVVFWCGPALAGLWITGVMGG